MEAVILSRRRAYVSPRLSIGSHPITLYEKIRYLGVILDKNLTFAPHVVTVTKKAARSAAALARLMPNIRGPCQWKWRLLASVVESQLLFASSIWADRVVGSREDENKLDPAATDGRAQDNQCLQDGF